MFTDVYSCIHTMAITPEGQLEEACIAHLADDDTA